MILVSLVIQLLIFPLGDRGAVFPYGTRYLHLLSYLPLLAFIWLNRRFWEILLMGLGILLNFLVILINGGYMPASPEALRAAGLTTLAQELARSGSVGNITLMGPGTYLNFLGDVLHLPPCVPFASAFSLGDLILGIGVALFLALRMRPRQGPEDRLRGLVRFLREMNRARNLREVGEAAIRYALELVPKATSGTLLVRDPLRRVFRYEAAKGWKLEELQGLELPEEKLPNLRYAPRKAAVITGYEEDLAQAMPDVYRFLKERGMLPPAFISLPIIHEGEVLGFLNIDGKSPDAFSEEDAGLLEDIREEVTLAVKAILDRERLQESEASLRRLYDALPDAVYVLDKNGRILDVNVACSLQTGYSREELIGRNIFEFVRRKPSPRQLEDVYRRLEQGEIVVLQHEKVKKDGTSFPVEVILVPLTYWGKEVFLSINRDISERKRFEEETRQHIHELNALNRALRSVVSTLESSEVLRRLTAIIEDLVKAEYTVIATFDEAGNLEELVDRPAGLGPFPVRLRESGITRKILVEGEPVLVEEILPDGTTVPPVPGRDGVPIRANPVLVKAGVRSFAGIPIRYRGKIIGILSVYSRKPHAFDKRLGLLSSLARTAAVALGNARLYQETRHLFEESPVSLWIEDFSAVKAKLDSLREEGVEDLETYLRDHPEFIPECVKLLRVVEVNRATLELFEVRDLEELKEKLPQIIPREVEPLFRGELIAIWEGRKVFQGVGINRTARGRTVHMLLRWRVFPGHERDYSRVLVSILDITDRVRAEERLRAYSEKLAALHRAVWELQRCRTVEEVCRTAVEGARGILGFQICYIGLVQGDRLVPVYAVGDVVPRPFKRGEGIIWRTLEEGRSFWGNIEEIMGAKPVDPRIKSGISVPIGDFGVLQAASFERDAFSEEDVRLAEILAGHVSEEIRRIRLEEELREQAIRDPLTGLYNRRYFDYLMQTEISRSRRHGHPLSLAILDLDNFKAINDRYGHWIGDEVLREVAEVIRAHVRKEDIPIRWGGDEFLVVFPETTESEAQLVAERIRQAVMSRTYTEEELRVGISAGVASWDPREELPIDHVLREADKRLYRWKPGGPCRSEISSGPLEDRPGPEPQEKDQDPGHHDPKRDQGEGPAQGDTQEGRRQRPGPGPGSG